MGILSNLDNDFFKPKTVQQTVNFNRDSFMACIDLFVETEIAEAERQIERLEHANWGNREESIEKQRQKIAVISGWKHKELVDRRLSSILSIKGLARVWGEVHPHIPFHTSTKPYVMAQTTDVILLDEQNGSKWDLGPYIVMLPLGGLTAEMHWIPVRDPKAYARHPHHGIMEQDGWSLKKGDANTCLGDWHGYVEKSLVVGDATSLLRFMVDYIQTYNPNSVLYHMGRVLHAKRL